MKVSAECMHCLVKRQADNIKKYSDEEKKAEYLGKVLGSLQIMLRKNLPLSCFLISADCMRNTSASPSASMN